MTKPTLSSIEKRDLQLLDFLREHDVRSAAVRFHMTEGSINSWLYRVRLRVMRAEEFLRQVRHLRHLGGSRIVKLTVSGRVAKRRLYEEEKEETTFE